MRVSKFDGIMDLVYRLGEMSIRWEVAWSLQIDFNYLKSIKI